ncbi:hypothetical protein HMPREF0490_00670 [Lachnospiraceae bacterium 6_1_37FAA]|nr:hypothetical protein HMPREF0490_00670 [Lachnospiraceae bacterium 6_1_37FAA]
MEDKFYQKPWFKNTILISIPTIISCIGIFISFVNNNVLKAVFCTVSVFLMFCLIIAVLFYGNQESKASEIIYEMNQKNNQLNLILNELDRYKNTCSYSVGMFSSISEKWALNINSFANEVIQNGKAPKKCWDRYKIFDDICSYCRDMIITYTGIDDTSKISVGFIYYWEDENREKWIHMVAHSNPSSTRPRSCKNIEPLEKSSYHYANLIKDNLSDIEIAINNEEIQRIFNKVSIDTDLSKYTQYIAIPVYCTSNKMLGIFQVITKYNYIINTDRIKLRKFAEENIVPYSNLIVLADKINKGLYVNPNE